MTIDWNHFTPWASLAGGILLGLASALFVLVNGRILGISGILGGLLTLKRSDAGWRVAFMLGLLAAPVTLNWIAPAGLVANAGGLLRGCRPGDQQAASPRLPHHNPALSAPEIAVFNQVKPEHPGEERDGRVIIGHEEGGQGKVNGHLRFRVDPETVSTFPAHPCKPRLAPAFLEPPCPAVRP